jgi:hypothetical protein
MADDDGPAQGGLAGSNSMYIYMKVDIEGAAKKLLSLAQVINLHV